MAQMILFTKQKQIMAKEGRLVVCGGERGGSGMDGEFGSFLDAKCYIWNGQAMGSHSTGNCA